MNLVKLENIADIFSGLVLSRFQTENSGKKYRYVTLKSIEDNSLDEGNFDSIKIEREIDERYLLKKGDVLFKLSPPYSTTEVDFVPENIIVPSNIAVIRVTNNEIDPRYISFYMSSQKFKSNLKKQSEGSALMVMKVQSIKNLEIKIINSEKQKEYCELLNLLLKKEKLRKRIIKVEEDFKNYTLDKMQDEDI